MNRPDYTQIDPTELEYPRRIIVKFVDNIGIPYEDGVENDLPADQS